MAMIKTDPSQTKTVVALLVVLAMAVGVTISRVSKSVPPEPIAEAKAENPGKAEAHVTANIECDSGRNPFAKPSLIEAAGKSVETALGGEAARMLADKIKISPWRMDDVELRQQSIAPVPNSPQPIARQAVSEEKPPLPEFELMTTVKGSQGYSAVIRTGGSETRVVEVGDKMEGGFKVVKIEPDRAVLTDGRDTIDAKRPLGSGERRAESGEHDAG
ncbi:MAG: hypothetical protein ACYC64_06110 [Armatimonadota bacterium]